MEIASSLHHEPEFWELVLEEKWQEVIEKYRQDSKCHTIEIQGRGTALHVAVSSGCKDVVKNLLEAIVNHDKSSLTMVDKRGATPLHLAAYRGFTDMCENIIGKGERGYLIQQKNEMGETPLFWAVRARKRLVFVYLQQFCPTDINVAIDYNNTSILHVAIQSEMFDLAIMIMYCYPGLISTKDNDGIIPLEILATRTSAFKSGCRLSWWKQILYYCFTISRRNAKTTLELFQNNEKGDYSAIEIYDVDKLEKAYKISPSLAQSCHNIQTSIFKWSILSLLDLEGIKKIKTKHTYGGQLLEEFMKKPTESYIGGGFNPDLDNLERGIEMEEALVNFPTFSKSKKEKGDTSIQDIKKNETNSDVKDTSYLIAASHGIVEMMLDLQSNIKSVIYETNSNNENALLLAVKNRQPHVIQWMKNNLPDGVVNHLILQVDKNENTVLHLAAYTSFERENTWRMSGVAMQMMWDIKWYKYIKELVPEHFNNKGNKEKITPSEVFKEKHKELLESSVNWLKDTAESCSVVAALIAGVSFATSGSVPGGNQQTGQPTLEGQPAFEGFAISSLIGLYFSVTALIMFLAILTSRKEVEDFCRNLPMKLLFGLCSLFVSIVAMFVSFCAGHFFVLTDKYTKGSILFYLYISICLPVTFYAAVQFPLFIDLVKVIWKKVPPPSVKGVLL
ncbi:uncharacterized protein LOC131656699 [Vicia villosa]|uniref:uncharacterized protein LOC131656699 n=1 Tax=Vicia villosa TaxID=3911 RepID=UPI00273CC9E6|nr:uncharacterized protein LOC131656699 [Vicia villosa]